MEDIDPKALLDAEFEDYHLGSITLRGYLKTLLGTLWSEGEGFSSKRPFGDSGWEFQLHHDLVEAGALPGTIEEDGNIVGNDDYDFFDVIAEAIAEI